MMYRVRPVNYVNSTLKQSKMTKKEPEVPHRLETQLRAEDQEEPTPREALQVQQESEEVPNGASPVPLRNQTPSVQRHSVI